MRIASKWFESVMRDMRGIGCGIYDECRFVIIDGKRELGRASTERRAKELRDALGVGEVREEAAA